MENLEEYEFDEATFENYTSLLRIFVPLDRGKRVNSSCKGLNFISGRAVES